MCWNATISLNTFVFSASTLAFIAYNNTYTKYKLNEFIANPWLYAVIVSFVSIQLVEYFLWRSIETRDAKLNRIASIVGSLIIAAQPLAVSMLITNRVVTGIYAIIFAAYILLKYPGNLDKYSTVVSPTTGSLQWKWNYSSSGIDTIQMLGYFAVFFVAAFYVPKYLAIIVAGTLVVMWWAYRDDERMVWGSKWCWSANILMFYYLAKIMVVLPFGDMMKLCRQ
jgi:hypothetical protein